MTPFHVQEKYSPDSLIVSKLRFYSAGIVAINKLLSSKDIEALPIEDLSLVDGQLSDEVTEYKAKAVDASGASYETNVKTTATIKATWLSLSGSNRITAPDVRRGELVMLYQFGDVDKYYWTTLKEDLKLRKLETVIYAFSGTRDENKDATADTTYYFEVSTHKKLIHLHTSKDDQEPYVYDIQLNTKEGILIICDDIGNYITLNSAERRIELKNTDGSHVDLNKKDIVITSTDSITLKSKNIIEESTNHVIRASSAVNVETPTASFTGNIDAGGSIIDSGGNTNHHSH